MPKACGFVSIDMTNTRYFRAADMQDALIGKKVARWEREHYFRPTS